MKQIIIILLLSCFSFKQSNNKERVMTLYVFEITELKSSYIAKTINNMNDTILVVVPKNNFEKKDIVKDQIYQFELIKMKVRVPHMEKLLHAESPKIIFEKDTICQCESIKKCPTTYLLKDIKVSPMMDSESIYAKASKHDSIIYVLPDSVEIKLGEYLDQYKRKCGFYLESVKDGMYKIYVSDIGESPNYWIKNTNRYVVIKDKMYPLFMDYDSLFSTKQLSSIGEYGKREGFILRSYFIIKGYNITFDKYGKNVIEDWGIFKKVE